VGKDMPIDNLGEPLYSVTLEEGDLLLIPRGVIHRARASQEQGSLHITVKVLKRHFLAV
ncbi:hypothetical protein Pmar_PMAR001518, partial [Perkinsus marinus ATCC 50983]